jgi:hypothetical protein
VLIHQETTTYSEGTKKESFYEGVRLKSRGHLQPQVLRKVTSSFRWHASRPGFGTEHGKLTCDVEGKRSSTSEAGNTDAKVSVGPDQLTLHQPARNTQPRYNICPTTTIDTIFYRRSVDAIRI